MIESDVLGLNMHRKKVVKWLEGPYPVFEYVDGGMVRPLSRSSWKSDF
jgi:hypothetical protein